MQKRLAIRVLVVGLLTSAFGMSYAGQSSTAVFGDLPIFITEGLHLPLAPITPGAPEIDLRITGDWTVTFTKSTIDPPLNGDVAAIALITLFYQGPESTDGEIDLAPAFRNVTLTNFTGTQSVELPVDFTLKLRDPSSIAYFSGNGDGTIFLDSSVLGRVDPISLGDDIFDSGVYLTGGDVRDLTISISAVPEPSTALLLLMAIGAICIGSRCRAPRSI